MMLPPFWIPWLIIMGITVILGALENERNPEISTDPRSWPPYYNFLLEFAARIFLLGGFSSLLTIAVWIIT